MVCQEGNLILQDMHSSGYETPALDYSQDKELLLAIQEGGMTSFIFRFPASNCHDPKQDAMIYPDRYNFILWALGDSDDPDMTFMYHGANKGKRDLPLLTDPATWSAIRAPITIPPDAKVLKVSIADVPILEQDTTYYCVVIRVPTDRKYHIYTTALQSRPEAEDMLHHTLLHATSQPPPRGVKFGEVSGQTAG